MAELSNGGTASALATSAARTRPSASSSATCSPGSGETRSSTVRLATSMSSSSRVIRPGSCCQTEAMSSSSHEDRRRQPIGAVLAGGRSGRMGAPKAGVELGGRPLVAYSVETLVAAGLEPVVVAKPRSEEHTSELQSHSDLVCRLLLEKKKKETKHTTTDVNNTKTRNERR